jgi:hypothetical protein
MLGAALLGSILAAFAMFVVASWAIYAYGLRRIHHLSAVAASSTYVLATGLSPSVPQS